jgi:hypothetical protein
MSIGLGGSEPRSEIVRQQTADGVATEHLAKIYTVASTRYTLTSCRARSIQAAFGDLISLHPSIDFGRLYSIASNRELEASFITLDELSFLLLPNNRFHLLRLDILVQAPLTYASSVLP